MSIEFRRSIGAEQEPKPIPVEEAVRRIRKLVDLREKKKRKEPLNAKEEQLLPRLEDNVNAWLSRRLTALAIPDGEMPKRVAQWFYESIQKNEEQKDYQEREWQWLKEEKKKPETERDPAYADRLSVYLMITEDAALARKWMFDQKKIVDDTDASPLKRIKSRDALKATGGALDAMLKHSAPSVEAPALVRSKKSESKTTRITDIWHKIIQNIVWPANIDQHLRDAIERRYAAQERKLAEAVVKGKNKANAVALFQELERGLHMLTEQKGDDATVVVDGILREVKQHVDRLPDESDAGKAVIMIKNSPEYLQLLQRFENILYPKGERLQGGAWILARRFIKETLYPKLKMVYNGTVPEEAYDRLLGELEMKAQAKEDEYIANKKVIFAASARRRRAEARGQRKAS